DGEVLAIAAGFVVGIAGVAVARGRRAGVDVVGVAGRRRQGQAARPRHRHRGRRLRQAAVDERAAGDGHRRRGRRLGDGVGDGALARAGVRAVAATWLWLAEPVKLHESPYVPASVCVVFSVTVPTTAPVSPLTPVIEATAVCGLPS